MPLGFHTVAVRITVLDWGSAVLVALPGEPFAAAAHLVRDHLHGARPGFTVVVAGYSDGWPGYLAPAPEHSLGGYEVLEAHRYYGMPGPFAAESSERVVGAAHALVDSLP